MFRSCLYKATVMHHRLSPRQHRFHYGVFMFCIDLDELDMLERRLWMLSRNRFNMFSFRDNEHLQLPREKPDKSKTTREHINRYLREQGMDKEPARIMLVTNLNVLGYNFNPVSFYFCFDAGDQPLCAVAEVSNTFREMKPYFIGKQQLDEKGFHLRTGKFFYVSPFIDHDTDFDFSLGLPGDRLNIRIDSYGKEGRFFISTLTGHRKKLNNINLFLYSLRFPLIPLQVITLIHWNALLLWLKKLPYRRKKENPELQQDVYRRYTNR